MIRSLYSGISGMRNHQIRMDVIGNNIANVNTTGFKSSRVNFQDMISQTIRSASPPNDTVGTGSVNPSQVGLGMMVASISPNLQQGALQSTGRILDIAIQGEGFFMIKKTEDANEEKAFYSREGIFFIDTDGRLVNSNGYFVCGDDGEIIDDLVNINSITISDTGQIFINGEDDPIATIGVAFFSNPSGLSKAGQNLYQATVAAGEVDFGIAGEEGTTIEFSRLSSGFLEMSNVDLTEEFTNMITTQRGYQANARTITVSDSLLEELINLKR